MDMLCITLIEACGVTLQHAVEKHDITLTQSLFTLFNFLLHNASALSYVVFVKQDQLSSCVNGCCL